MSRSAAGFAGSSVLVPGELRGYRRFRLGPDGLHPTVHAGTGPWSGHLQQAACAHGQAHDAPGPGCGCGLYGWYHPADARPDSGLGDVSAVIAARGRVVLGEHGFRAASARVEAVALGVGTRRRRAEQMLAVHYPRAAVYRSRRRMLRRHPPQDMTGLGVRTGCSPASRYRAAAFFVWVTGVLALYSVVVLPRGVVSDLPLTAVGVALAGFVLWQALLVWLVMRGHPAQRPSPP